MTVLKTGQQTKKKGQLVCLLSHKMQISYLDNNCDLSKTLLFTLVGISDRCILQEPMERVTTTHASAGLATKNSSISHLG